MKIGTCEFCGRKNIVVTEHHLIPKATHSKKKVKKFNRDLNRTVNVCRPCHSHIHAIFSEKELAINFNTINLILAKKESKEFVNWIKDKPNELKINNKMSNRRRGK